MAYLLLAVAIGAEILATTLLKLRSYYRLWEAWSLTASVMLHSPGLSQKLIWGSPMQPGVVWVFL